MCVPVTGGRAEGEEGEEAVVSGWIAVHVEAAAARRKGHRSLRQGREGWEGVLLGWGVLSWRLVKCHTIREEC